MSKIGLVILLILMAGRNYAQDYFVLIQADNNQPFYAHLEGESRIVSSSAQGHLILSQLKDGAYTIIIGFPKQLFPEQQFSFSIRKKDLEFQLKDLGDKGWGLFNPQTLELKTADEKKAEEPKHHLEGVKKDDAFSRLMAGVVSDTAVMYNTYAMEATLKDSPALSTTTPAAIPPPATIPPPPAGSAATPGDEKTTGINGNKADSAANKALAGPPPSTIGKDSAGTFAREDTAVTSAAVTTNSVTGAGSVSATTGSNVGTSPSQSNPSSSKTANTSGVAPVKDTLSAAGAVTSSGASPSDARVPATDVDVSRAGDSIQVSVRAAGLKAGDSSAMNTAAGNADSAAASRTASLSGSSAQGVASDSGSLSTASPSSNTKLSNGTSSDSGVTSRGAALTSSPVTPAVVPSIHKTGGVVKLSERKTTKGYRLVYTDNAKGAKTDTIVVIIPVDSGTGLAQRSAKTNPPVSAHSGSHTTGIVGSDTHFSANAGPDSPARSDHPASKSDSLTAGARSARTANALYRPASKSDSPATGTRSNHPASGLDRPDLAQNNMAAGQKTPPTTPLFRNDSIQKKTSSRVVFVNSDCKNFATDYDVDKLRVKLLETAKDEDRVTAAHKVFKTKCFSTRQIRALSEVFTSDAWKYKFFETAYPFVSDEHFKELADLLADPVYNSKFKTMTGLQ